MTESDTQRTTDREIELAWDDRTDAGAPPKPGRDGGPPAATAVRTPHHALGLSDEDVVAMYRQVLIARAVDERMWLMQRAGKIAFIISVQGHEVAQVGITWPLRKGHDWMAPFYRSIAAAMTFGMTPEDIITAHLAKGDDISSGGRQMPGHYGAAPHNILSVSSPVGTQVLHAVGIALGAWVRGDDAVAITQFGEGTANQGEVHEAMNFAGVHKLPMVFVCENNGYAISVPWRQAAAGTSPPARRAMASPASGRRRRSAGVLRGAGGGHAARPHRRGSDADRGEVVRLSRTLATTTSAATATPPKSRRSRSDPIVASRGQLRECGVLDEQAEEALDRVNPSRGGHQRVEGGRRLTRPRILRHVYVEGA